ncbi:MAG: DUF1566 domain-containing protein [Deltaproteobacteria bacterium]|nr:DUF1566 domain-containing protein [Deltaproteobacteria bacterium]
MMTQKFNICFIMIVLMTTGFVAAADFTDNGDSTVTDNTTRLIWQQQDDDGTRIWIEALSYCEGLSLASNSDWRLPNIRELESIVNASTSSPAINSTYFPNTNSSTYWSSTPNAPNSGHAWFVSFSDGRVSYSGKSGSYYVRCVRGGD